MLPNLLQYPVALFGALRAGLVVVIVNPLYTARELEHQRAGSGAAAIVVLENFARTLEEALPRTRVRTHCAKHLTGCKLPKHVEFRTELPKTPIGKILRRELKKQAVQDEPAARA